MGPWQERVYLFFTFVRSFSMLFSLRDTGFHAKKSGNAPFLDRKD